MLELNFQVILKINFLQLCRIISFNEPHLCDVADFPFFLKLPDVIILNIEKCRRFSPSEIHLKYLREDFF